MAWLAVAIGGAIGSVARYGVNHLVDTYGLATRVPAGTLIVNVVGCFVIGLLAGMMATGQVTMRVYWREFVFVGLLGGFTTFSAFGLETFVLARTQAPGAALFNVAAHVVGGLVALWAGYRLGL